MSCDVQCGGQNCETEEICRSDQYGSCSESGFFGTSRMLMFPEPDSVTKVIDNRTHQCVCEGIPLV